MCLAGASRTLAELEAARAYSPAPAPRGDLAALYSHCSAFELSSHHRQLWGWWGDVWSALSRGPGWSLVPTLPRGPFPLWASLAVTEMGLTDLSSQGDIVPGRHLATCQKEPVWWQGWDVETGLGSAETPRSSPLTGRRS